MFLVSDSSLKEVPNLSPRRSWAKRHCHGKGDVEVNDKPNTPLRGESPLTDG